jgi:type IV pilus assembly protein PilQ
MLRKLSIVLRLAVFAVAAALATGSTAAQTVAYCNITGITTRELSNGIQVVVRADGVLRWDFVGREPRGNVARVTLQFANAKSQLGRNFIDVSKYPVSYVSVAVPQNAKEGVGVQMAVAMYEASSVNVETSSDQQSVIITVNSQRTLPKRNGTNGAVAAPPGTTMSVTSANGSVSVSAVKAKLNALLAAIAHETGQSVVVDDSIRDREVSLQLENLPADRILSAVASAAGLAFKTEDGVTMVSEGVPTDLATYHLSQTESFRMRNTKAQAASGLLPTFLYSYLHVNEAQNAVVVTAPPQMLDKIRADFQKIDVAPPQIMIDALAVEFSGTEERDSWLSSLFTDSSNTIVTNSALGAISYSTIGTLPRDFTARLNAIVTSGKAAIRANPRMAAVNGQDANLFIGRTRFIRVELGSGGYKQERIQGVDVGVKLTMRSWTGGNGEITVTVTPETSNITELDRDTGLPVLATRRAETTVRVKDGETIVIGGLTQRQEYESKSKVPLLGDIPLVGEAFKRKNSSKIESELVIFVTPHILTDRGRLQDDSKEQAIRDRFK